MPTKLRKLDNTFVTVDELLALSNSWNVSNHTSDYTLLVTDSGKLFTNSDATTSVSFMLPTLASSYIGKFRCAFRPDLTNFTFFIDAGTNNHTIYHSDNDFMPTSCDGSLIPIDSINEGYYIELLYIGSNKWQATAQTGRWVED